MKFITIIYLLISYSLLVLSNDVNNELCTVYVSKYGAWNNKDCTNQYPCLTIGQAIQTCNNQNKGNNINVLVQPGVYMITWSDRLPLYNANLQFTGIGSGVIFDLTYQAEPYWITIKDPENIQKSSSSNSNITTTVTLKNIEFTTIDHGIVLANSTTSIVSLTISQCKFNFSTIQQGISMFNLQSTNNQIVNIQQTLFNSLVLASNGYLLSAPNAEVVIQNSIFTNISGCLAVVQWNGGSVSFPQTTFQNNFCPCLLVSKTQGTLNSGSFIGSQSLYSIGVNQNSNLQLNSMNISNNIIVSLLSINDSSTVQMSNSFISYNTGQIFEVNGSTLELDNITMTNNYKFQLANCQSSVIKMNNIITANNIIPIIGNMSCSHCDLDNNENWTCPNPNDQPSSSSSYSYTAELTKDRNTLIIVMSSFVIVILISIVAFNIYCYRKNNQSHSSNTTSLSSTPTPSLTSLEKTPLLQSDQEA
ncbi:putative GATA-binding transcription factor [Tieghemostelium lacteum]|uniref:Putative GATA-binding transcription factor n=1 Tax=Tieghemostelium lacteum TaxID=361077 RepID=A0A151ZFA8_TIELA|nr:putative GATA-binding transcription factor [Tieghemostelium lacteum]|eukprot:KYQ92599.1 putative GATA-binding transcription factor [Tieghemostelium lacteum]